jgi:polysaccharide pyruvyl transferase WcaK-like protein
VVVTGAYHAAVFALAQGVPAVVLAANEDYFEKFRGLANQFDVGCRIVSLSIPSLARDLAAAIDVTWEEADRVRPVLREAAWRQARNSEVAYARLPGLVAAVEGAALA